MVYVFGSGRGGSCGCDDSVSALPILDEKEDCGVCVLVAVVWEVGMGQVLGW